MNNELINKATLVPYDQEMKLSAAELALIKVIESFRYCLKRTWLLSPDTDQLVDTVSLRQ